MDDDEVTSSVPFDSTAWLIELLPVIDVGEALIKALGGVAGVYLWNAIRGLVYTPAAQYQPTVIHSGCSLLLLLLLWIYISLQPELHPVQCSPSIFFLAVVL